jgi:hypothetical protein
MILIPGLIVMLTLLWAASQMGLLLPFVLGLVGIGLLLLGVIVVVGLRGPGAVRPGLTILS